MKMNNRCSVLCLICLLHVFVISCNQHNHQILDPESIKSTVYELDTTIQAFVGHEPKDSDFIPLPEEFGQPMQETYDTAKVIWNNFVSLCMNDKFKDAYDYFNDYQAYFMIGLKHSTNRYLFYDEVIKPMVREFNEEEKALKKYIDILQIEYLMEVTTMSINVDREGYIPKVLPVVIYDLGVLLAKDGRIDDAVKLIDNYAYAVEGLNHNSAYTNMCIAAILAEFYDAAGERATALDCLEQYIEYTKENMDPERDPKEYEFYIEQINYKIKFKNFHLFINWLKTRFY